MEKRYLFLLATILCLGQQADAVQAQQTYLRRVVLAADPSAQALDIKAFRAGETSTEAPMSEGAQVKLWSDGKYFKIIGEALNRASNATDATTFTVNVLSNGDITFKATVGDTTQWWLKILPRNPSILGCFFAVSPHFDDSAKKLKMN